ncbi:MAG: 50S ribosomal protein L4, partial [Ktedonobacterales bacterium]
PIERKVLLLMPERDENVVLSARNLYNIKTDHVSAINVVEILKYDHLLMPVATIEKIVTMFGQEADDALQMKRHPRVVLRRRARRAAGAASAEASATAATAPTTPAKATTKPSARATKTPKTETPAATDATDATDAPDATSAPETGGTTKRARGRTEEK